MVVTGTPIDLGRPITSKHPIRHVRCELEADDTPTLTEVLEPILADKRALAAAH